LWRKTSKLRIVLGADRLIISEKKTIAVQPTEGAAEWRAAIDALPGVLESCKKQEASVVLADQLVRYALLPWNAALKTDEQWLALARHRFASIHGSRSAEWEIKLTETAPAGPRLACAVDRELIAGLTEKFTCAGVRLVSVQPFLVAAFNRIRGTVGGGSCWIVVEEPGRLTLAFIDRGVWIAIRSRRIDERWRKVLPEILERESAFLALEQKCTRVIVCAQGAFDTQMHDDFRTQALSYPELAMAWE
jgi:hypothetical protein